MASDKTVEELLSTKVAEKTDGYSDPDRMNQTTKEDHPKEVVIGVDLFAVVVSFAVLLTLSSVGTVSNVAVLAVIKYRKSFRAAIRRDAILVNLSIAHLILCFVLAPIEFATLAENYVKHSLPGFLCLARDCGFQLLVGAIVIGVVILAGCQARRLQRACAATRSTGWCDSLPVLQLVLPWIVGACAAGTSFAMRFVTGLGFEVCRKSIAFLEQAHRDAVPWQFELLPGLVYFLLLFGALIWLVLVVEGNRKYADRDRKCADRNRKQPETAEDTAARGLTEPLRAGEGGGGGGGGGGCLVGREISPTSARTESAKGGAGGGIDVNTRQKITETQENDECEEDDDTFDLKMRHEFQKKSRSSGRRHTVANIGLPDLSDLRSSTFADAQPGYASKTAEYHYVRKWSVDITALANQLENPKSHSDTSPFKEKEELGYEETFKGLRAPSSAGVVSSCEYLGRKTTTGNEGNRKESIELRSFQKSTGKIPQEKREMEGKNETENFRRNLSPPSTQIVASRESPTGGRIGVEARDEGAEPPGQRAAGALIKATLSSDDPQQQQQQRDIIDDDRVVAKARRELTTTSRMTVVILVSMFFTFPCLVIFLWLVFAPFGNVHIGYNLSIVAEVIITIQAAINPIVLFWVDLRLQRRLRNLIRDAAHVRCVCYCNIGRHGNCLQPYKGPAASYRQAPADGSRLQKV